VYCDDVLLSGSWTWCEHDRTSGPALSSSAASSCSVDVLSGLVSLPDAELADFVTLFFLGAVSLDDAGCAVLFLVRRWRLTCALGLTYVWIPVRVDRRTRLVVVIVDVVVGRHFAVCDDRCHRRRCSRGASPPVLWSPAVGLVWAGLGWSARSLSGRTNLASAAAVDSSPSPWSTGSHPPSSSSYPTPRPPPSSLPAVDRSLSGRIRRTTTRLRLHVPALPTSTKVVFQLTVSGDIIAVDW